MIIGLQTAAAGLQAETVAMDALADDIANDVTPGFKAVFASAVSTQPVSGPGTAPGTVQLAATTGVGPATQVYYGGGAVAVAASRDWSQGALQMTQRPWDVAIQGPGLFRVRLPGGQNAYTRAGSFSLDSAGTLVDHFGHQVLSNTGSPITVPLGKGPATIAGDGTITVAGTAVAQIGLAAFRNPGGLQLGAGGEWLAAPDSGPAQPGVAGAAGFGTIVPGSLEGSNTDMGVALADMIETERSYDMDAQAVSSANHMWQLANQIKA